MHLPFKNVIVQNSSVSFCVQSPFLSLSGKWGDQHEEAVMRFIGVESKKRENASPPVCPCTCFPELKSRACIPAWDGPLDLEPGKADRPRTGAAAVK